MSETIVLYHGGCRDGFCAAWVVNKFLTSPKTGIQPEIAEFIPAYYGQEPPNVTGKTVIIVDFCYPLETMKKLMNDSCSFVWLDHHKTAQPIVDYLETFPSQTDSCKWVFDNSHSGAGIAWDYFFPNEPRPWLVDYVEDRDLWAKKLPNTDWVNAYISILAFDLSYWDVINSSTTLEQAMIWGSKIEEKTNQYVREVCKNTYFVEWVFEDSPVIIHNDVQLLTSKIPIVNICQVDCSEVLHELCKQHPDSPFTLYWFKRQDGLYQYGLRSIGDFDCSTVAKLFGGGGHKNAAGFQLPYLLEELK